MRLWQQGGTALAVLRALGAVAAERCKLSLSIGVLINNSANSAVSVLMPVHNAGEYLLPAVASILEQSYSTFELLLVDDRCNDGALYNLPRDPRIKIIRNSGRGLVDALNTGLQAAKFALIARMDADDIAHPTRLTKQVDYLEQNPEVTICGCNVEIIAGAGVAKGYQHYQAWINNLISHSDIEREFFIESPIAHPSAMFSKDAVLTLGGYQDHGWPEDYDLWFRALLAGYKFGKPAGKPLLQWRDYSERTSRCDARYHKNAFIACKAQALVPFLNAKSVYKSRIWGAGPTGLKLHDELTHRGFEVTGFIDVNPKMQSRKKREKSVQVLQFNTPNFDSHELQPLEENEMVLVAVSARGARNKIRSYLERFRWVEGVDFLFAA